MRWLLFFLLFSTYASCSIEFNGVGYGKDEKEAKEEALADISRNIRTEVLTTFKNMKSDMDGNLSSNATSYIQTSSHLPIVGSEFEIFKEGKEIKALVTLSQNKAELFYVQKLEFLSKEIEQLAAKLEQSNDIQSYLILSQLLQVLDEYDRYHSVAIAIGIQKVSLPAITKYEVNSRILQLSKVVNSIEEAAIIVANAFRYEKIFIYPPQVESSNEVTPFAKAITSHLKGHIKSAVYPNKAKYRLRGNYQVLQKGLILTYILWDVQKDESVDSITVTLLPDAYQGIRTEPISISFEKLLQEGIVYSDDLKVSLTTNKGDESVLFKEGEEIELFVKLNHTGYFYLVGHTQTQEVERSYLVELEDAIGKDCFIRFVSADDANHWISLGKFNVEEPYGLETLQVIASDQEIREFPYYHYDKFSGFNIIDKDVNIGLKNTRSILKSKKKKTQYSEAVLMFTTYE